MKKKALIVTIILLLLLVVGFVIYFVSSNKDKPNVSNNITSFTYSFGSYDGGYYNYAINQEGNKYIFTANGMNGVDLDVNETIDHYVLDDIQEIIQKYNVKKWNGFNKRDRNVLDGHSFSLLVRYSDHKIKAAGYMKYPKNYKNSQNEIKEYFDTLVSNKL